MHVQAACLFSANRSRATISAPLWLERCPRRCPAWCCSQSSSAGGWSASTPSSSSPCRWWERGLLGRGRGWGWGCVCGKGGLAHGCASVCKDASAGAATIGSNHSRGLLPLATGPVHMHLYPQTHTRPPLPLPLPPPRRSTCRRTPTRARRGSGGSARSGSCTSPTASSTGGRVGVAASDAQRAIRGLEGVKTRVAGGESPVPPC